MCKLTKILFIFFILREIRIRCVTKKEFADSESKILNIYHVSLVQNVHTGTVYKFCAGTAQRHVRTQWRDPKDPWSYWSWSSAAEDLEITIERKNEQNDVSS